MTVAVLHSGNGERRVDARYELIAWAEVRRSDGERAGKVLVTDISRAGFNMQSRWDFSAREEFLIDLGSLSNCEAKVAWHDPVVGGYGCRFSEALTDDVLTQILSIGNLVSNAQTNTLPWDERRSEPRFAMHVPMIARRADAIEREVVVLTDLSIMGFRMRSTQNFDLKQTVYVELGPSLLAEARIGRRNEATGEYAGTFNFALAPALIERLINVYIASTAAARSL